MAVFVLCSIEEEPRTSIEKESIYMHLFKSMVSGRERGPDYDICYYFCYFIIQTLKLRFGIFL